MNTVSIGVGKHNADLSELSIYDRRRLTITMNEIAQTRMPELQAGGPSCKVLHDILWSYGFYLHVGDGSHEWGWTFDAINRGLRALDLYDVKNKKFEDMTEAEIQELIESFK